MKFLWSKHDPFTTQRDWLVFTSWRPDIIHDLSPFAWFWVHADYPRSYTLSLSGICRFRVQDNYSRSYTLLLSGIVGFRVQTPRAAAHSRQVGSRAGLGFLSRLPQLMCRRHLPAVLLIPPLFGL